MGTWGSDVFDDDTTLDVLAEFRARLVAGG